MGGCQVLLLQSQLTLSCFSELSPIVWVGFDTAVFRWWFSIDNEPFLCPWTEKCGCGHNEAIVQLEMVTSSHPSQRKGHATFTTQAKKMPTILSHKERVQMPQNTVSFHNIPPSSRLYSKFQKWLFLHRPSSPCICLWDKFKLSSFSKLKSLFDQHQSL